MQQLNKIDKKLSVHSDIDDDENDSPTIDRKPKHVLTNQVLSDVKSFIKILLSTVISFYNPVLREDELSEMKEDLVETITNLVLTKDVYKIMFSFFRIEYTKVEQNLRERYRELKYVTPSECKVNEYFRMDETSPIMSILKDVSEKNKEFSPSEMMRINFDGMNASKLSKTSRPDHLRVSQSMDHDSPLINISVNEKEYEDSGDLDSNDEKDPDDMYVVYVDDYDTNKARKKNRRSLRANSDEISLQYNNNFEMSKIPKYWEIKNRIHKQPFHDAVIKLREIEQREGPMMKLRLLEKVNQMIKDDIWKFWEGVPINEHHLTITSDTKIPLYIYLVLKAKLIDLPAQIRFIQEFTTKYVHENNLGSNLALYESAMIMVADKGIDNIFDMEDQDQIVQRTTMYNQSFAASVFIGDMDPFVDFDPNDTTIN